MHPVAALMQGLRAQGFWLVFTIFPLAIVYLTNWTQAFFTPVAVAGLAVALWRGLALYRLGLSSRIELVDKYVRIYEGRLVRMAAHVPLASITDIASTTGPLGRRFGYGEVQISTAGTDFNIDGVVDAGRLADQLNEVLGRRPLPAAQPVAAADEPAEAVRHAGPEEELWTGRASGIAAFSGMQGILTWAVMGSAILAYADESKLLGLMGALALAVAAQKVVQRANAVLALRYRLTTHRVVATGGVLTKWVNEARLEHITDVELNQAVHERLVKVGTVVLNTSSGGIALRAIPDPAGVVGKLRERGVLQA